MERAGVGTVRPRTDVDRHLVFFDIDGTLLSTDGAGRAALRHALTSVFGTAGPIDDCQFHGKTDPQIARELLLAAGVEEAQIERRESRLWSEYLAALEIELNARRDGGAVTRLPGVPELLVALQARGDVRLGLLTGNLEPAARLKLAAAAITTRFAVGGYGSDSAVRTEIARIAHARARARGREPMRVVVVGDTPADVACARELRGVAIGVATGRHRLEELLEAGADAAFEDLRDTDAVLKCILAGERSARGGLGRSGSDP